MAALSIQLPFPVFTDSDGQPVEGGYVWIGRANRDPRLYPVNVYFDKNLTIPAGQPLRTVGGYIVHNGSPAQLFIDGIDYSILVQNRKGIDIYSFPSGTGVSPNSSAITYLPAGTGAVARTVQGKLREVVSVKDFGAVGDGVTNDTAAIQAAIDAGKPYSPFTGTGRLIYFPPGRYKVTTIDMTDCHGVHLVGAGPNATELFTNGTNQVIKAVGSSAMPLNKAGIKDMTIRGGGSTNTNAHGVDLRWANTCYLENLVFHGCRHAVNLSHQWQTYLTNLSIHGAGNDLNYIGVFMDATDAAYSDNAVIANGVFVQGTSGYGFRIINGQGSKFVNCEAGGSPMINGWYVGDPPVGTFECLWMHFVNCLGDSTIGPCWLFRKGAATKLGQIQLTNCWAGNGDYGFYLDGVTNSVIANALAVGHAKSGILLHQCAYNVVSSCVLVDNNEDASTSVGDIQLQAGMYNKIVDCHSSPLPGGKSLLETLGTDSNTITGNTFFQGATIIGANTLVYRNQGFKTEQSGSAQILPGDTSVVVPHALGITPSVDNIRITPRDNMGSATKFWVSAADATSFTLNVNTAPGATITFGWSIDLVRS